MLYVEQILKNVYKFYKHSSKRKKGLKEVIFPQRESQLIEFVEVMTAEVENGEADLAKRPSLRIQYWNATRWLGRSACLNSLCRAYEYILAHLSQFAKSKAPAEKRVVAKDLYEKLTAYETFLFIFFYKDLASIMANTSKQLQFRDIRIRDVGRRIMNLCTKLKTNYSETSQAPTPLIGEGSADDVMNELFGTRLDGIGLDSVKLTCQISSTLTKHSGSCKSHPHLPSY